MRVLFRDDSKHAICKPSARQCETLRSLTLDPSFTIREGEKTWATRKKLLSVCFLQLQFV